MVVILLEYLSILQRAIIVFLPVVITVQLSFPRLSLFEKTPLVIFFVLVNSHLTFILLFLMGLKIPYLIFIIFYFSISLATYILTRGWLNLESTLPKVDRKLSYVFLVLLLSLGLLYFIFSRPAVSTAGALYAFVDYVKFYSETNYIYPPFPEGVTFTNVLSTSCNILQGLLNLLNAHLEIESYFLGFGLVHGIFTIGFVLCLVNILRELNVNSVYGLFFFPLIFIRFSTVSNFNIALSMPTQELASYFLLSFCLWLFVWLLRTEKADLYVLLVVACSLAIVSRPYFFSSCISMILIGLLSIKYRIGNFFSSNTLSKFCFLSFSFFGLGAWYFALIFKYKTPFPIMTIFPRYEKVNEGFLVKGYESILYFFHLFIPNIESFFRNSEYNVKEIFNYNEINPILSLLLTFSVVELSISLFQERISRKKSLLALYIAITFLLTSFLFVSKSRIFEFFTPLALVAIVYCIARYKWSPRLVLIKFLIFGFLSYPLYSHFGLNLLSQVKVLKIRGFEEMKSSQSFSELVCSHFEEGSGSLHMRTSMEPGLDDVNFCKGMYFWDSISFHGELENLFESFNWDYDKIYQYLNSKKIKSISIGVPYRSKILFLTRKDSSEKFWDFLDASSKYFVIKDIKNSKFNYYGYRSLYILK